MCIYTSFLGHGSLSLSSCYSSWILVKGDASGDGPTDEGVVGAVLVRGLAGCGISQLFTTVLGDLGDTVLQLYTLFCVDVYALTKRAEGESGHTDLSANKRGELGEGSGQGGSRSRCDVGWVRMRRFA